MAIAILGVVCIGWGDLGLSEQAIYGDILSFFKCNSSCRLFIYRPNDSKESITLDLQLYSFCIRRYFYGDL